MMMIWTTHKQTPKYISGCYIMVLMMIASVYGTLCGIMFDIIIVINQQ